MKRPLLIADLDAQVFRRYYYLKEELIVFCRENGLVISGSKLQLTERIVFFLETGKQMRVAGSRKSGTKIPDTITLDTLIGNNMVCSEKHRIFFRQQIGPSFTFRVPFQKWLKLHAGSTYAEAVKAWYTLLDKPAEIGRQFEYNRYIRDFFRDNSGKSLQEAIRCWKYKKELPGLHRYERNDLWILNDRENTHLFTK